eukprot:TRINITY_DN5148_c0_g3_i1.p1 TRINITY_DN5148_c0_g3~~TRINITY_DN5148_c0_g3_i1.p1  ORF type:complete len:229 (+),score=23.88 TRINITY_DN5148_c0_g3_i1:67-753(+)
MLPIIAAALTLSTNILITNYKGAGCEERSRDYSRLGVEGKCMENGGATGNEGWGFRYWRCSGDTVWLDGFCNCTSTGECLTEGTFPIGGCVEGSNGYSLKITGECTENTSTAEPSPTPSPPSADPLSQTTIIIIIAAVVGIVVVVGGLGWLTWCFCTPSTAHINVWDAQIKDLDDIAKLQHEVTKGQPPPPADAKRTSRSTSTVMNPLAFHRTSLKSPKRNSMVTPEE